MSRKRVQCPLHIIPLLGVESDVELARKAGVSPSQVATWRHVRKITLPSSKKELAEEVVALIGTMPDSQIAAQAGLPLHRVRNRRLQMGLPSFTGRRGRVKMDIPPEAIPLLGVETDRAIGERFGVSNMTVGNWRRRKGILHTRGVPKKTIPEDLVPLLGVKTDPVLAKMAGVSSGLVRRWREDRGIPPHPRGRKSVGKDPDARKAWLEDKYPGMLEMLGVEFDDTVGSKYGLSRERIRQFRGYLGLGSNMERKQQVDEEVFAHLAGTMPDGTVAKMFGVNPARVRKVREGLGLPAVPVGDPDKRAALESIRDDLGKVSDHKLAARVGIASQAVQIFRNKLGIPPAVLSPRCKDFEKIDREEVRRLILEGNSDAEVARILGRSSAVIGNIRTKELHLPKRTQNISPEKKARIVALIDEGVPDVAIAEEVGVSVASVGKLRRRKGILRGHPRLGLDRDQMRALYEAGHTDQEVADIMGCNDRVAANIRTSELRIHKERAKINQDEVTRMFHEGYTDFEMCEELGCSPPYLRQIRRDLGLLRQ